MPDISCNGEAIYYEVTGSGPVLILLHSLGSGVPAWKLQVQAFAGQYRVVVPDLRGHGRSTCRGGAGIAAMAADVAALIQELGGQPAVVVGLSMGGLVAQVLAADFPGLVRALVLSNTFAIMPGSEGEERIAKRLADLRQVTDMAAMAVERADGILMATAPPESRAQFVAAAAAMNVEGFALATEAVYRVDLRPTLHRIKVPTLIVVGDKDERTPYAMSAEIADRVPGSQIQILPGAGHIANIDNPKAFNEAVGQFLTQVLD